MTAKRTAAAHAAGRKPARTTAAKEADKVGKARADAINKVALAQADLVQQEARLSNLNEAYDAAFDNAIAVGWTADELVRTFNLWPRRQAGEDVESPRVSRPDESTPSSPNTRSGASSGGDAPGATAVAGRSAGGSTDSGASPTLGNGRSTAPSSSK